MAETVEYALVVMASALFVAGSVATYGAFASFESGVQFRAEFEAISTLVSTALVNGSSRASMSLPATTIGCESGTVSVRSGSMNGNMGVGIQCDFQVSVPQGTHAVAFAVRASGLDIAVS